MTRNAIPLLPHSIAVGLQPNLIQYLIELKFILLFFEKPLAVLSTPEFDFIDIETIEAVKKRKPTYTNILEKSHLVHMEVLATEEWQELMSHCNPWYYNYNVTEEISGGVGHIDETFTSDSKDWLRVDKSKEILRQIDEILISTGHGADIPTTELWGLLKLGKTMNSEQRIALLEEIGFRLEMQRLLEVLERCRVERIPMIWGDVVDVYIAGIYTKYLLDKHPQDSDEPSVSASLRLLKGSRLLNELLSLEVVNLATIPVSNIVQFRKSNIDLLENFLTDYRRFLTEIQNDPQDTERIVLNWTQKIVEDLNTLNKELLLTRREKEYKWLQRVSEAAYEGARKGTIAALWSFFGNPVLLAGTLGGMILEAAQKFSSDIGDRKEKEEALLFRSSSGYLWKARKRFKKD